MNLFTTDKTPMIKRSQNGSSNDNKVVKPVAISIGAFALLTFLLILFYVRKKKIQLSKKAQAKTKGNFQFEESNTLVYKSKTDIIKVT